MKKPSFPAIVALSCGAAALAIFFAFPKPTAPQAAAIEKASPPPVRITEPMPVDAGSELFSNIGGLEEGRTISLPLPGGRTAEGRLNYVKTHPNSATAAGGDVVDGSGTFEIAKEPWGYRGFILQRAERIAYVYSSDGEGRLQVARRPLGEVICEPMPGWEKYATANGPDPEKAAIYNDGRSVGIIYEPIPILHSLPRAEATIYLDFDGEVIEGQSWEGGRRIVAPAHNLSAAEVTRMWRRVAEDFAPFEVNVTTDLQAYLRAPQGRRMRCITTTNNFANAGGVAFSGTFRESGDTVCWNFYSGNAGAVVISHEVGHTFNLAHDGLSDSGYYSGHGSGATSWGPIMGAPYDKNVCQWSKGDYVDANENQDDLEIIGSMVPRIFDDHEPTPAAATPLTISGTGTVSNTGIIASQDDIDAFTFTTGGGAISLQFAGYSDSPNLDIEAKLLNAAGTTLLTSSAANQLSASLSTSLAAGTYAVTVNGVGNAAWASNGYDDYGSIGGYTISGSIAQPSWRFRIPANSLNSTVVGTVASGGNGYLIASGNTGSAFAINGTTGALRVANAAALAGSSMFNLNVSYTASGSSRTVPVEISIAPLRGLKQDIFTGLGGNAISQMTSSSNYPNNPNISRHSPTFQTSYNAENYGQRISGYLLPTETGNHVFWTASDDISELWLSTDANPANKVRIASNAFANGGGPGDWTSQASQQSSPISLIAGQRYYIELLHRERTGGEYTSVAWQTPTRARQLIATEYLEYPGTPANRAPWVANMTFRIAEGSAIGSAVGQLVAGDFEPGSVVSAYTITSGNTGNAFSLNATTGALTVNGMLSFATLQKYLLNVRVTDSGGLNRTAQIAVEVEPRAVKRELWSGVTGQLITDLTNLGTYPNSPTSTTYTPFFETPTNTGDNYGQKLSGYLRAPDSGSFTFWVASDDGGELWLSTDASPANKRRIAYLTGPTNPREWGKFSTQRSAAITLEGGKFYYIEALHKEGAGGDNLAVSWSGPDFGQVILGTPHVTQEFYNHAAPVVENRTVSFVDREEIVTTIEAKDWADPGTTVTYSITAGNADGVFAIDPVTGVIRRVGPVTAGTRNLTVTATDNGPTSRSGSGTVTVQITKASLKREVWTEIAGSGVGDLTSNFRFPGAPDELDYLQEFRSPSGTGENYGQRVSGYLIPPTTGDYTFWIASDDNGELWLSTDARATNRKRIATVNGAVGEQQWTSQSNQQSAVIRLNAGQAYYIEALQKEGVGGDHLAVAWQGPGISRTLIGNANLEYPDEWRPALKREVTVTGSAVFNGTTFSAKALSSVGDNYSQRLSGYLVPPATGSYTFWLASDDTSQLLISPDENPANLVQIASLAGAVSPEAWDSNPSQKSASISLVAGQRYYLQIRHQEFSGGDHVAVAWQGPDMVRAVIANEFLEHPDSPADRSLLKRELYNNISGGTIANLTSATNYPGSPATVGTLTAGVGLVGPTSAGENFGERISGYLVAPENGRYTFWIASDDSSELYLSSDENPANKVRIAGVSGSVLAQAWDQTATQKSAPISLMAGQRYYLEVLHKESTSTDHLAVAWQGPLFSRRVIENRYLEHPSAIPGQPNFKREVWTGIGGSGISSLTSVGSFLAGNPNSRGVLTTLEAPAEFAENFGQRITGTLIAPESGNFSFWIAGGDSAELWLSPDSTPANRMKIATTNTATAVREWTKFPSQQSGALPLIAGQRYHIEVLHKAGAGSDHVAVAWQGPSFSRQVLDGRFVEYPGTPPPSVNLKRERWTGISGNALSALTASPNFPNSPNQTSAMTDFEVPTNVGDNYGQKISGYLIPPVSGSYQFWIASDDASELSLSTNELAANKARIAYTDANTGLRQWTQFATQESVAITLVAGQRYYIEALHKEGGGDDFAAVAWQGPGIPQQIISRQYLEYPGAQPGTSQSGAVIADTGVDPGYAFWIDFNALQGQSRSTAADPDSDGISNALEFVLGGNPSIRDSASTDLLPKISLETDWVVFEFRRAQVAAKAGPFVEYSTDFKSWIAVENDVEGVEINSTNNGFGPGIDRVSVRIPRIPGRAFFRLNSNISAP